MKKLVLIILLSYLSMNANSQLVKKTIIKEYPIGNAKKAFTKFAELGYYVNSLNDTTYHLFYRDEKFTQIEDWKSLYFKGGAATVEDLYQTLIGAVNDDKGKETAFDLGESSVFILTTKFLGSKYITIQLTDAAKVKSILTLNKAQINSLFSVVE